MEQSTYSEEVDASRWQTVVIQYIAAAALLGIAFALMLVFPSSLGEAPFLLVWTAVILAAAMGGLWLGIISLFVAVMGLLLLQPGPLSSEMSMQVLIQGFIFLTLGLIVIAAFERSHRMRKAAIITEQYLETMVRSARDFGILSMDKEGRISTWSSGAKELFGYSEEEVRGQRYDFIFTPEDQAQGIPQHELDAALATGSAIDERWSMRKDGSRLFASGVTRPMCDHNQRMIGYIKVLRDATPARIMEQERTELLTREQQARQELQLANDTIMRFVAVISHEVRTPLTSIKGMVSTLLQTDIKFKPEQQREFLTIVEQEADRLNDLTGHLLDYSRLHLGKLHVAPEPTSVMSVIDRVQPQLRQLGSRHQLVIDIADTLPEVDADAARVGQVIMNLFGNAVRYTPYDTKITLSARVVDGYMQISMADEGPGIPPDKRSQIFGLFEQLGIDRRGESEGAGLGLSIAKGLVEAHSGKIWIEDKDLPGTTISFTLPLVTISTDRN